MPAMMIRLREVWENRASRLKKIENDVNTACDRVKSLIPAVASGFKNVFYDQHQWLKNLMAHQRCEYVFRKDRLDRRIFSSLDEAEEKLTCLKQDGKASSWSTSPARATPSLLPSPCHKTSRRNQDPHQYASLLFFLPQGCKTLFRLN